jgi:hypothetical protein
MKEAKTKLQAQVDQEQNAKRAALRRAELAEVKLAAIRGLTYKLTTLLNE